MKMCDRTTEVVVFGPLLRQLSVIVTADGCLWTITVWLGQADAFPCTFFITLSQKNEESEMNEVHNRLQSS